MVDVNIFEKFVKEYFELEGYFLHENINYGNKNNEADLLGIHLTNKPIHVEITEQNYSPEDLEKAIKRKFYNDHINKLYLDKFQKSDVRKVYVIWGYKKVPNWDKQMDIGNKFKIEILSYEDVFKYFDENTHSAISSKNKNKINSLLNMFKHYKKHS